MLFWDLVVARKELFKPVHSYRCYQGIAPRSELKLNSGLNGVCSQLGALVLALGGGMFSATLEAYVLVLATSAVPP